MKRRSFYIAALLVCAFVFGVSAWAAHEVPAGPQDLDQLKADLATLRETVQRQLVESPPNVPIGTILAYAGPADAPNLPEGWRICNGAELSRADFAQLFTKIGVSWGKGNGTSTFNLPDLRGRFLRGVDGGSGNDPDASARVNRDNLVVGPLVGSLQLDALVRHRHLDSGHGHGASTQAATRGTERVDCDDERGCVVNGDEFTNATVSIGTGNANLGDAVAIGGGPTVLTSGETRPKNAYVNWVIRVK